MTTSPFLQQDIQKWFKECQGDLPWRHEYLPYQIWISEIMLQQTQMGLWALICHPKQPPCPIIQHCQSHKQGSLARRPLSKKTAPIIPITMATGVLVHKGKLFIQQRLAEDVWGSLWEFPGGRMKAGEHPTETVVREFFEETELRIRVHKKITTTLHHYNRYRVTLHCFLVHLDQIEAVPLLHAAQGFQWIDPKMLDQYAFPAGHRKLIRYMEDLGFPLNQGPNMPD